ncbi:MAG: cytochrome C [Aquabacterium sp.]|nr:cytochrome C [Aquabacterium sp.]
MSWRSMRIERHAAMSLRRWCFAALLAMLALCFGMVPGAQAQSIESVLAPGDVITGHAKIEQSCSNCHVRFNPKGQDALCMACHKEVGQDVALHQGLHGRLKGQPSCRSCHTDHKGRPARIVQLDTKRFDHQQTDYLLKGKHVSVACDKCHNAGKKYWQAPAECISCHKKDDVHKGGITAKCVTCHRETGWKDLDFDHGKQTHFTLEDKHAKRQCDDCHANARFKDTPKTCIGCHKKDDEHKGQFGTKCETCHKANLWKDVKFNHDSDTSYVLRGKHRKTACGDCHTGALYRQKLPQTCWDCHKKDDKHKDTLGKDCASCHSESGWKDPARFDHEKTRFPLLGKHIKAGCKDCHKSALFKEASMDCYACHQRDDKHEGTLGKACSDCHSERDWKSTAGRFSHDRTRFALRNAHASITIKCADCHQGGPTHFKGTATACYSCHKKDDKHDGTQGHQCEQCHGDRDWNAAVFDHGKSRFPLTGSHGKVECKACHATKRFKDTQRECIACHLKEDKHKGKLGSVCETCHNARNWKAWDFNHTKQTSYALTGAHLRTKCDACHKQPAPRGKAIAQTSQRCVDCHNKDDPHDGQFGGRCEQCHSTASWIQVDKH